MKNKTETIVWSLIAKDIVVWAVVSEETLSQIFRTETLHSFSFSAEDYSCWNITMNKNPVSLKLL